MTTLITPELSEQLHYVHSRAFHDHKLLQIGASQSQLPAVTCTCCPVLPSGDDDDQHCRPRGRFALREVRKCISNSIPCRPERDCATGEGRIQEGSMRWHPAIVTPRLIFVFFGNQIREVDEWEKDIKEGGKYFFTR